VLYLCNSACIARKEMKYFPYLLYYTCIIRFWNIKISNRSKMCTNTTAKFSFKTNVRFICSWHLGLFQFPKILNYWNNFLQKHPKFFPVQTAHDSFCQHHRRIVFYLTEFHNTSGDIERRFRLYIAQFLAVTLKMFYGILVRKRYFRIILLMQHLGRLLATLIYAH
jgi:hypothetical protein